MTVDETIKSFECCGHPGGTCKECPLYEHISDCRNILHFNAKEHLINQRKEIKKLKRELKNLEIVRCKDCKYRYSSEFCECREPDAYCSDGERMDGEEQ